MAKNKNSFVVTVTTDEPISARALASGIREAIYDASFLIKGKWLKGSVSKVTVSPVGER